MSSEWVRDNKRKLLFQKRTINGRTRVYGKAEQGSGGHYGYEGYVDPDEKFIRRPDGERIGRGNHPDLIHAEAQRRRQAQVTSAAKFTNSHSIHSQVKQTVSVKHTNNGEALEGIAAILGYSILLIAHSFEGLTGFGMLLNVLFLAVGVLGICIWNGLVVLAAIGGMLLVHIIAAENNEDS